MQALEYQMQQGLADAARQDLYVVPLAAQHEFGAALHATTCILKLLQTRGGPAKFERAASGLNVSD
jgi:hypothetical protein